MNPLRARWSVRAGSGLALAVAACLPWVAPALTQPENSAPARRLPARVADDSCASVAGLLQGSRVAPAHVTFSLAANYTSSWATVSECARTRSGRWVRTSVTAGRVGSKGFAAPGAKREGDRRSPTGIFTLGTGFGARNPGSRLGYLTLTPRQCWGSTVGSTRYNRPYLGSCPAPDERMFSAVKGAYRQGIVVNYNTAPIVPGRGSAIFVHVRTASATSGCLALPEAAVIRLMRTNRPGDLIIMGVAGQQLPSSP